VSADSRNTCPACYSRITGVPIDEITQLHHLNNANDIGLDDQGYIVFEYHEAECRDCGYRIPEFTLKHPIPPIEE
jgi:DNA-directed RNA polymerase subunit RPC12/RpoP